MSTTRSIYIYIYIYTCKRLQYCSISDIKLVHGHSDCHDTERWQVGTCVKNNNAQRPPTKVQLGSRWIFEKRSGDSSRWSHLACGESNASIVLTDVLEAWKPKKVLALFCQAANTTCIHFVSETLIEQSFDDNHSSRAQEPWSSRDFWSATS